MPTVNILEYTFHLYLKPQNRTKTLIVKQKNGFYGIYIFYKRLDLFIKHTGKFREVQKSMLTGSGRTGKFRSHCSLEREELGSLEAISCHFARRNLSSAVLNFFGNWDPVMLCPPLVRS